MVRRDECSLHVDTNILLTPLAEKCSEPFSRFNATGRGEPASARCCASALSLRDFKSLCGKRATWLPTARSVERAVSFGGAKYFESDLMTTQCPTLVSMGEVRGYMHRRRGRRSVLSIACIRYC